MEQSIWNSYGLSRRRKNFWDNINKSTILNNTGNYSQTYYSGTSYMNDGRNVVTSGYDGYKDSMGTQYTRKEKGLDNQYLEQLNKNGEKSINHNIDGNVKDFNNMWSDKYSLLDNPVNELLDYGFNLLESRKALQNSKGDINKALKQLVYDNRPVNEEKKDKYLKELLSSSICVLFSSTIYFP